VACVPHHGAFFGEGFKGVAGDEPGRFDAVFLKEFEETGGSDMAGEEAYTIRSLVCRVTKRKNTSTDITGAVFAAVRS
jgi:hypothetical protein